MRALRVAQGHFDGGRHVFAQFPPTQVFIANLADSD